MVQQNEFEHIPPFPDDLPTAPLYTIDYVKLRANDPNEVRRLYEASHMLGFFYLANTGIKSQPLFDMATDVFENMTEKEMEDHDAMKPGANFYGFKRAGSSKKPTDTSDFFNISKDDVFEVGRTAGSQPAAVRRHKTIALQFMKDSHNISLEILRHLSKQIGLEETHLPNMHRFSKPSGDLFRMTRALPQSVDKSDQRLDEHSDFGSVSVLFNQVGGLQLLMPKTNEWVWVKPVRDTPIVNLGDAMTKLSNGLLRSNIHRVYSPPGLQRNVTRTSIVYFCRPEDDVMLRSLVGNDSGDKEEEEDEILNARDWIRKQVTTRMQADMFKPVKAVS